VNWNIQRSFPTRTNQDQKTCKSAQKCPFWSKTNLDQGIEEPDHACLLGGDHSFSPLRNVRVRRFIERLTTLFTHVKFTNTLVYISTPCVSLVSYARARLALNSSITLMLMLMLVYTVSINPVLLL
jgi:hypothetical protein